MVVTSKRTTRLFWKTTCLVLGLILVLQTVLPKSIYHFWFNVEHDCGDHDNKAQVLHISNDGHDFNARIPSLPIIDRANNAKQPQKFVGGKPVCSRIENATRHISINRTITSIEGLEQSIRVTKNVARVAIVIPFRDRDAHLRVFLNHMHPFLQRNQLHYRIFVIHQIASQSFNRAKLMNVGYVEASKHGNFTCFVFHDVDLLPVVAGVPYNCSQRGPLHMIAAMDKYKWGLPYAAYFGGVCAFTPRQFRRMNGFSNSYWGWGGEDDDAWARIRSSGQAAQRVPKLLGQYAMIRHGRDKGNSPTGGDHMKLLHAAKKRWQFEGLRDVNYTAMERKVNQLYTEVVVDLQPPVFKIVCYSNQTGYRLPASLGRYVMIRHAEDKNLNEERHEQLERTKLNWMTDGLSSIAYILLNEKQHKLYHELFVDLRTKDS